MNRREFIRQIGLGLAAGWAAGNLSWPRAAQAEEPGLRLALLADAHLKDGRAARPEARALARAVAGINALAPRPDLVLMAGDLAHKGRPDALDLGKEILSDLPAPLWVVRGEGDQGPAGSAWGRRFGEPNFSRSYRGCQVVGLDTVLGSRGPVFEIGAAQRQWLAQELAALDPAAPLVILSHAPLARLFFPWRQWTGDAPEIAPLLSRFPRLVCLHGHLHVAGGGRPGPEVVNFAANRKPATPNHLSLPATSWSLPLAIQGTPAYLRPGPGPHGCGWALATLSPTSCHFRSYLWQA
jgi:Icc protein